MSLKRKVGEAALVLSSIAGQNAAAQTKDKEPAKIEQTKKQEAALDPEIRVVLEERDQRLKNPENAKDPGLVKFIEEEAYKKIAKIMVVRLEKFGKPGSLTEQEEKDLKLEAKKLGLTYDLANKCLQAADAGKLLLNRVKNALSVSAGDIQGPPNIFKKD